MTAILDFLKVVRLVFWSGVVGPGTNFRSLALRAHSRATRSKARLVSKSTAILVYQDNPVGVEFFSYASDMQALSFVSINLHRSWPRE